MNALGVTVLVAGVGARTAVGLTAAATAAAVRAGIAAFANHPFFLDGDGNPFLVARSSYLDDDFGGAIRLAELAGPAAAEAVAPLAKASPSKLTVPAFVGLPSNRPGRPKNAATAVTERVQSELSKAKLQSGRVQILESGHAAGAMALQAAWDAIRSGSAEFALAGGVDSYLEPETLLWLEANRQVHGAGGNSWGFVPGEAAGFTLLASAQAVERLRLDTAALELITAATARETKLIKTDTVCLGEGLTALFRSLLAGLAPGTRADDLICDMNGEPYRADEFGFAVLRAGELFRNASEFATPAAQWGDVGAAAGPLFVALSDVAVRKGYSSGPIAAAFTSAETGERCGFVVRSLGTKRKSQ